MRMACIDLVIVGRIGLPQLSRPTHDLPKWSDRRFGRRVNNSLESNPVPFSSLAEEAWSLRHLSISLT
jgi:hypothetical protein